MSITHAEDLSRRGSVNVYLVDPERLNMEAVQTMMEELYPGESVMLHTLFKNKVNLNHIVQHTSELQRKFEHFDPAVDRLVIIGRSMANFLVGWVLGLLNFPQVTLLMYDFEDRSYTELTVDGLRPSSG